MNIWGFSEEGIEELALTNPTAIQALRSLISKMEQSAARDELRHRRGYTHSVNSTLGLRHQPTLPA